MKYFCLIWVVVLALSLSCFGASDDPRIEKLNTQIEEHLLKGDYSGVEQLRSALADRLEEAKRYSDAAHEYELLLAARPAKHIRLPLLMRLAHVRELMGEYAAAIQAYEDVLHDDGKHFDARLGLARAYTKTELYTSAVEAYQHCLRDRPQRQDLESELAFCWQRLGYLNRAIECYERALKKDRKPAAYLGLADCYVRQDQLDRALQTLMTAKAELPGPEYDVRIGDIQRRRGDLGRACAAWEEALKSDSRRDDIRLHLALTYNVLGRSTESDRLFKQLLSAYPQSPLLHFSRAWVLLERGEYRSSREEARRVLDLEPTEAVRHYAEKLLETLQKRIGKA